MYWIAGCDEVGRGALAGPLVAAAVIVRATDTHPTWLPVGRDSKLFSASQRQGLAEQAMNEYGWSLGWVEAAEIDVIGLQAANHLALHRALADLAIQPEKVLADYVAGFSTPQPFTLLVGGDQSHWPIALASIIAKVHRDHYLQRIDEHWPQYGFSRHVGYGTAQHLAALRRHGPCVIHRKSFGGVQ